MSRYRIASNDCRWVYSCGNNVVNETSPVAISRRLSVLAVNVLQKMATLIEVDVIYTISA